MKKLFNVLLVSMLLVTGCGSKEEEKEKEPIKDNEEIVDVKKQMTKDEVIVEAKTIVQAAISQYSKNTQDGSYINAGAVGELDVDKIYSGFWCYDDEAGSVIIKDVDIEGYICTGNLEVMECEKK